MLERLQHQHAAPLTWHEAIAMRVERPARLGGVFRLSRKHLHRGKRGESEAAKVRLGAARQHHVGISALQHPIGVAQRLGRRGASSGVGVVRSLETELDRDLAGSHVGDNARNEEGRNPFRAALAPEGEGLDLLRDFLEAADPGAQLTANPRSVFLL